MTERFSADTSRVRGPYRAKELTHDSFGDFVQNNRLAVVHFWAAWNAYDLEMRELLDQVVPAEIAFGGVDVDQPEHLAICQEHRILNLPFLAFYRDGVLVQTLAGVRDLQTIVSVLNLLQPTREA